MAAATKRTWKLQEFVAHGANVNCLALGHKSGRVMVTGGEDKKVNMWAVGKPNCIMSLSGHTSPVEAVRFGNSEEMVVAGSMSGALKIWDLEAAKIVRTLTGHKASIRSLDFHPYGDFVVSGSLDTNIKLWDIRRKGCIFTYKGHTNCVNCLRFSPDGRWIASAGEDGVVKLWDLTAGKQLTDFRQHAGPVNCVEFHPNEFLLATGSSDRTVKFWDLEKLACVSSTDGDCPPVSCIFFHPEGSCLYAGAQEIIKVYGWEPARCFDSQVANWGRVVDISLAQTQLIGAAFSQSNVSTFVVDIQRLQPLGGTPTPLSPTGTGRPISGRRSFVMDRPPTQSTNRQASTPKVEPEEVTTPAEDPGDDAQSIAHISNPDDYREIFQPRHQLARESPPKKVEPFPAPPDDGPGVAFPAPQEAPWQPPVQVKQPAPASAKPQSRPQTRPEPRQQTKPEPRPQSRPAATRTAAAPAAPSAPAAEQPPPNIGLNMDDFLPKRSVPDISSQQTPSGISETEAISSIGKGHDSMNLVLLSRQKNLQLVRALWTGGNIKTALDSAVGMNDQAILVDLMNVVVQKQSLWNLDLCTSLLPQIKDLLSSKYESYVTTGCMNLRLILKNFASVIKSNVAGPPSHGVDISREERYRKCKSCYGHLMDIRTVLDRKPNNQGKLVGTFRELQLLMNQLD